MKTLKVSELHLLLVNLQLFAEGDADFTDAGADVVDLPSEDLDLDGDLETGEDDDLDDADSDDGQSKEDNDKFKKMRLKAEAETQKKFEAREAEIAAERQQLALQRQELEQAHTERKILEDMLSPQKIYERADADGITEDMAEKMIRLEASKIIDAEKAKVAARFVAIQQQKDSLKADKLFHILAPEVEKVISQRPDLDFQTVYYHMKGMRGEELSKQIEDKAVKRTLANVQDRARRGGVGGSNAGADSNVNVGNVLSSADLAMTRAFGNDAREIAKHVQTNLKKKE